MDILSLLVGLGVGILLGILLTSVWYGCKIRIMTAEADKHEQARVFAKGVILAFEIENKRLRTINSELTDQKLRAWSIPDRF